MTAPVRQRAFAAAAAPAPAPAPAPAARSLGLYGHIRANRARAAKLLGLFFVALQLGALGALALPLMLMAPGLSPFANPLAYLGYIVPAVTFVGLAGFGFFYVLHVHQARQAVDWRDAGRASEPRLFRILEPLCIGVGMPCPKVGIIESPARNAFACGHGGRSDVLVLTRGLIDALDDDELEAVIAHELTHIRYGDVRLIAVVTVLARVVTLLTAGGAQPMPVMSRIAVFAAFGWRVDRAGHDERNQRFQQLVFLSVFPFLLLIVAASGFIVQTAARAAYAARLSIGVSREFIADAGAVEMTKNPAALVSALRKIEGHSTLGRIAPEYDAMMIDGDAHGADALHPTIAERVAALARTMGSMVHVAVRGRDTRDGAPGAVPPRGFGRRGVIAAPPVPMVSAMDHARDHERFVRAKLADADGARAIAAASGDEVGIMRAFWRVGPVNGRSVINSTPEQSRLFAMALCLAGLLYGGLLLAGVKPTTLASALGASTSIARIDASERLESHKTRDMALLDEPDTRAFLMLGDRAADRCVKAEWQFDLAQGLRDSTGSAQIISGALDAATGAAFDVPMLTGTDRDDALRQYVRMRAAGLGQVHAILGDDGLAVAMADLRTSEHEAAIATLRTRLADPAFAATLPGHHGVAARLLATDPASFIPCAARHAAAVPKGFVDRAVYDRLDADGVPTIDGYRARPHAEGRNASNYFLRQDYRPPTVAPALAVAG